MNEEGYVKFLEGQKLSPAGIATRKRMAKEVMEITKQSLDEIVADDELMYQTIKVLQKIDDPAHTPRQNALRKYYTFKNGKEFPRIVEYERNRQ